MKGIEDHTVVSNYLKEYHMLLSKKINMTQWVETSESYLLIQSKEDFSKKLLKDEMNWCSNQCSILISQSMTVLRNLIKGYQTITLCMK